MKKNYFYHLTFAMLMAAALAACSDDKTSPDTPNTQPGTGTETD